MNIPADWLSGRRPVSRLNAAEAVFEDLRDAILSGKLPVETRLPSEARLAESYGVSRPMIREALRSLQTLGLTRSRAGSGSFVISNRQAPELVYGTYSARELIEARPFIEVPAAAWAATRRSDVQAAELLRFCERMEACEDPAEWTALDSGFHSLVADASGNTLFARIVLDAREALMRQSGLVNLTANRRQASDREHRLIAEAIAEGSENGAGEAMRSHLAAVEAALSQLTGQSG